MSEENQSSANKPGGGVWSEQKILLRERYTKLTDADLQFEAGKREEMLTKIQMKFGITKAELDAILAN